MRLTAIRAATQPHTLPSTSKHSPTFPSQYSKTPTLPFNKSQISWGNLKQDKDQCHSPKLGQNWMQYMGFNHWECLLDPLDDNLRSEILRYGQFIEAAYRSFDFNPSSSTYATCRYSKASLLARTGMRKPSYKVTKNLRATCGIKLPKWIDNVSKLPHIRSRSSWIGYVAVCHDKKEIARLGRREIVIALRGTGTCLEWFENLRATLTTLPNHMCGGCDGDGDGDGDGCGGEDDECMVENGFLSLYVSKTETSPSLQEMLREEVEKLIKTYRDEPLSITITGHSLGAALAILSAYDITTTVKHAPLVTVISFGGPRVGNDEFSRQLEHSGTRILRIVNSDDVITKVPGLVVRDGDVAGDGVHVGSLRGWLRRRVEDMQLVYADVGQELRLSSSESQSPYLKGGDVATCHDLKTYLHLVNGFVSSSCPYMTEAWL